MTFVKNLMEKNIILILIFKPLLLASKSTACSLNKWQISQQISQNFLAYQMKLSYTKLSIIGTPLVESHREYLLLAKPKTLKLSKFANDISKIRLFANKRALL